MQFYLPTKVYLEDDCVSRHKDIFKTYGKRAFIVTGRHSSKVNGSLHDVTSALDEAGIAYDIFSEVEENPSVETVVKAAELGKAFQADFVIGIGGGSPLDASKAIALLMNNPEETGESLTVLKDITALPVICVPTTCGTGSEVTGVSVLTYHEKKTKGSIPYRIYPEAALVDGKYLLGAKKSLIVGTSIDALAHCLESYLSVKANTYNRMFSSYGLKLWGQIKEHLFSEATLDLQTAQQLMLVSTVAGMAIAHTGTSLPHGMSYRVTYKLGLPHGKACGLFLAAYMREYTKRDPETISQVLSFLGFENLEAFDACIRSLMGPVSVSEEDMLSFAETFMTYDKGKLSSYPYEIDKAAVEEIFRSSFTLI